MEKARILQPEQAIRRTKKIADGTIYNVVETYKKDLTGVRMVILQNPFDPSDIVTIAEQFVQFVEEVVEIYEEDIKPAAEKVASWWTRVKAWFSKIFG